MRRSSAVWGTLGLVCLVFGLIDYFIAAGFQLFVIANVVVGVFFIIIWLTSSRQALTSMVGQRSARYGANAAIYSLGFIALLVGVNYVSSLHHRRFDLTSEKVYSLSDQSVKVARDLKKSVKLYGFFQGGENTQARQLFEEYSYASPKVTFEMVDPDRHPEKAEHFKVSTVPTVRVQYGGDESNQGTNLNEVTEQAITNAIIRVTKSGTKTVYFSDGHGEANPDGDQTQDGFGHIKQAIEGDGFDVKKVLLASQATVPDDCTVLIIAGPEKPLLPHEVDAINDYLKKGGRVVVMVRPPRPDQPIDESALIKLVSDWGVKAGNDIVVDQVIRLYAGPALGLTPFVETYDKQSPVTKGFDQRTVFPMARSVTPIEPAKDGLTVNALAKTSDTSWAETDLDAVFRKGTAKLDSNDMRGPITVVDSVTGDLAKLGGGKGEARLVVFGSTDFADNQYVDNFYNRDFFMNAVDWLAGEASQISIRPRALRASRFRLTVDQFAIVFALSVLTLPEILLILGIVAWWERRN